jgi:DNA-binding MurR/RpiR family transcriptional regulator
MAHQAEAQTMSITELAEASKVAEATVSRFCRRLGYKGYNAFKLALAQSNVVQRKRAENPLLGEVQDSDSFDVMCEKIYVADVRAMGNTKALIKAEDIIAAVQLMNAAGKVLFMGQGGSMILAEEAAHLFSTTGGKFFAVSDSHNQSIAASATVPGDVIMYFSYSGAIKEMIDTLHIARERGANVILVTRFPQSPGAAMADVVLQCGANESPLQLGSVSAKVSQLYLMDVLLSEYCRHNMDECLENRKRIADALADKHM